MFHQANVDRSQFGMRTLRYPPDKHGLDKNQTDAITSSNFPFVPKSKVSQLTSTGHFRQNMFIYTCPKNVSKPKHPKVGDYNHRK